MTAHIADALQPLAHPVEELSLLPGNPRRGDVDAVARSYERFGQRKPIVALPDGTVIAGNHQLLAARKLGWDRIAVVFVNDDDATATAFALADNRTSDLGSYDRESLVALLQSVAHDDELLSATGYTVDNLSDLLMSVAPPPLLDDLAAEWDAGLPDPDGRETSSNAVTVILSEETARTFRAYLLSIGDDDTAVRRLLNGADLL